VEAELGSGTLWRGGGMCTRPMSERIGNGARNRALFTKS
jgi:hypothetical protein